MKVSMNMLSLALLAMNGVTADQAHTTAYGKDLTHHSSAEKDLTHHSSAEKDLTHHSSAEKAEMAKRKRQHTADTKADTVERSGGVRPTPAEEDERSGHDYHSKAEMDNWNTKRKRQHAADTKAATAVRGKGGGVGVGGASASSCHDVAGWYDSAGDDCEWYETTANACSNYGASFENFDMTANTACCICGGGAPPSTCSDVEWIDSGLPAYTCSDYEAYNVCSTEGNQFENQGHTANSACCACGGGCFDAAGWYDSDGPEYDCEWYENNFGCSTFGDSLENLGRTANTACCACAGVVAVALPPTVQPPIGVQPSTGSCVDKSGSISGEPVEWADSGSQPCNCACYVQNNWCGDSAINYANFGYTANAACCACGGGDSF